ncbi:hypothetical protein CDAR_19671 [Caerostris darwini]|uniref:Uncharacterized protein n=1 Tax=Caerostris darwini TaxID=1538125 RepID=A0AAV4QCU9_9ARAC|nr:hypothetical protein CDAR_19671 [Caerostris darwini]
MVCLSKIISSACKTSVCKFNQPKAIRRTVFAPIIKISDKFSPVVVTTLSRCPRLPELIDVSYYYSKQVTQSPAPCFHVQQNQIPKVLCF